MYLIVKSSDNDKSSHRAAGEMLAEEERRSAFGPTVGPDLLDVEECA
jgi:hypothetical protein